MTPAPPTEQERRLRAATEDLFMAMTVGDPWQVSACQREWDEALAALSASQEALRDIEAATRKPNGVITNEWYWGAVSTVRVILDALERAAGETT